MSLKFLVITTFIDCNVSHGLNILLFNSLFSLYWYVRYFNFYFSIFKTHKSRGEGKKLNSEN